MRSMGPRSIIVGAALLASTLSLWLVLASTHDDTKVRTIALILVVSWSFLASGLVALARRERRFGALMCGVGLAVHLPALSDANASVPFTIGGVIGGVWIALLVHALLAFPTGRLGSRARVATAAAAYLVVTAGPLAALLFYDVREGCPECPENAVLVSADETASAVADTVVGTIGALVALAVVADLAARWGGASRPQRRALAPVLAVGGAALVALAFLFASYAIAPGASDVASWVTLALLAAFPFAFLLGLLRMRLARSAVGRLVVDLGEAPAERDLRDALRRALDDPDLTVAYWQPERRAYIDADGRPVELPRPGDAKAASIVERGGEPVAALIHDAALDRDPELVEAVVAAAGLALENESLQAELRARLDDLHASRARIVEAQASERRRLERDLHDGAQQRLVALALHLRLAETRAESDTGRAMLSEASSELAVAIDELRELARGIHPAVLSDHGLSAALEALAARTPLAVELDLEGAGERLPEAIEVAAYYMAAEVLTNVVKHAQAEHVTVAVRREPGCAVLEVADDGVGGADPSGGSGLRGLRDRVEALGGTLEIVSPPRGGTRVRAAFPLHAVGEAPSATEAPSRLGR